MNRTVDPATRLLKDQPATPEETYEWLKEAGSDRMTFHFQRPPKANESFSEAALEELQRAVSTFIAARLTDHWDRSASHVPAPHDLVVDISVTIDGKQMTVPLELTPFFEIDGSLRH